MATMLGFVTTDAAVAPALLQRALKAAVDDDVQRDHASTASARRTTASSRSPTARAASRLGRRGGLRRCSSAALRQVCEPLAIGIVRGGEGATKLVTVRVTGGDLGRGRAARGARHRELAARQDRGARRRSELGTARRGGRPLGGGRSCSTRAAVRIGPVELFSGGAPHDERAPEAAEYLKGKDILVEVDLGTGGSGQLRGCGRAT